MGIYFTKQVITQETKTFYIPNVPKEKPTTPILEHNIQT